MQPVARSMHVLSLGLWLGMGVFFNFIVGLSLFHTFEAAGEANPRPAWFPQAAEYAKTEPDLKLSGPKEQGSRAFGAAVGPLFALARCAKASGPTVAAAAPVAPARFRKSRRV